MKRNTAKEKKKRNKGFPYKVNYRRKKNDIKRFTDAKEH